MHPMQVGLAELSIQIGCVLVHSKSRGVNIQEYGIWQRSYSRKSEVFSQGWCRPMGKAHNGWT